MSARLCLPAGRRGFSLIGTLVAVALLLMLAAFLLPHVLGGGKSASGKPTRAPMTMAKDTVCRSDIQQVRQAIQMSQSGDTDGRPPQSLADLRLPRELLVCPVGGEAYLYDPQTGQVRCPHPGHESY